MTSTEAQKKANKKRYKKSLTVHRNNRMRLIDRKLDKMLPKQYIYLKERISILLRELPPHFLSGWGTMNYMSGTVMYILHRDGHKIPDLNVLRNEFGYKTSNKRFHGNKFYKKLKLHFKHLQSNWRRR